MKHVTWRRKLPIFRGHASGLQFLFTKAEMHMHRRHEGGSRWTGSIQLSETKLFNARCGGGQSRRRVFYTARDTDWSISRVSPCSRKNTSTARCIVHEHRAWHISVHPCPRLKRNNESNNSRRKQEYNHFQRNHPVPLRSMNFDLLRRMNERLRFLNFRREMSSSSVQKVFQNKVRSCTVILRSEVVSNKDHRIRRWLPLFLRESFSPRLPLNARISRNKERSRVTVYQNFDIVLLFRHLITGHTILFYATGAPAGAISRNASCVGSLLKTERNRNFHFHCGIRFLLK